MKSDLRILLSDLSPYIIEQSGGAFFGQEGYALVGLAFQSEAAAGVDVLSHKKKAVFWRQLVELFPNMIDYVCNPDVDPVSRANCLQPASVLTSSVSVRWFGGCAGTYARRPRRVGFAVLPHA